ITLERAFHRRIGGGAIQRYAASDETGSDRRHHEASTHERASERVAMPGTGLPRRFVDRPDVGGVWRRRWRWCGRRRRLRALDLLPAALAIRARILGGLRRRIEGEEAIVELDRPRTVATEPLRLRLRVHVLRIRIGRE